MPSALWFTMRSAPTGSNSGETSACCAMSHTCLHHWRSAWRRWPQGWPTCCPAVRLPRYSTVTCGRNTVWNGAALTLIDPCAYHGDREVDAAAPTVFDSSAEGFFDQLELAAGWRARLPAGQDVVDPCAAVRADIVPGGERLALLGC